MYNKYTISLKRLHIVRDPAQLDCLPGKTDCVYVDLDQPPLTY